MIAPGVVVADRYVVEELVGEGGLAQVWKVRHRELGSVHALKLLLFRKPRLMERLILEGRIQAQLRHPNIVAVTDVVRTGGQVGLMMEYVDGVPLQSWMESNPSFDVDRVLELFAPILAGVRVAHDAGVLHRDLKPSNILLARSGRGMVPKVTDFGIAKVLEAGADALDTRSGAVMGTPGYLAPEQAMDASRVDRRADVFALGAILYEMLTGRRAFDSSDVYIPPEARPDPMSTYRTDVPRQVEDAVLRACAWDPAQRFSDVLSFAQGLFIGRRALLDLVEGSARSGEPINFSAPAWGGPDAPRPTIIAGSGHSLVAPETVHEEGYATGPYPAQPAWTPAETAAEAQEPWTGRGGGMLPPPAGVAWTGATSTPASFGGGAAVAAPVVAPQAPAAPQVSQVAPAWSMVPSDNEGEEPEVAWTTPPVVPADQPWSRPRREIERGGWDTPTSRRRPAWILPVAVLGLAAMIGGLVVTLYDGGGEVKRLPAGPPPAPAHANAATMPSSGAGWRGNGNAPATPEPSDAPAPAPAPRLAEPARAATEVVAPPVVSAPEPPPPAVIPAPEPRPSMPGAPPDLTGAWRGSANGLPCTLRLQESPDGNVSGEATLTLGPTASSFRVAGKVKPDGTMNLRAVDGDLAMNAQFLGGKLRGTYKLASTPTPLAWSAERR